MAHISSGSFLAMKLNNGSSEVEVGGDVYQSNKMGGTSTSAINYQMFLKKKSGTLSTVSQPHHPNNWISNAPEPDSPMLHAELMGKYGKFGEGIKTHQQHTICSDIQILDHTNSDEN